MVSENTKDLIAIAGLIIGGVFLVVIVGVMLAVIAPEIVFTLMLIGMTAMALYGLHRWWTGKLKIKDYDELK